MRSETLTKSLRFARRNVHGVFSVLVATMMCAAAFGHATCSGNQGQTSSNVCYAGGSLMSGSIVSGLSGIHEMPQRM